MASTHQNLTSLCSGFNRVWSQTLSRGSQHTPLSQGCLLKRAPTVGMEGREHIPRSGEGRSLQMPGPGLRSTGSHILSITSFNSYQVFTEKKEMQMAFQFIKRSLSLFIVGEITVKITLSAKQTVGRQFFKNVCLFIWLCWALLAACRTFFFFFSCSLWNL